MCDPLDETTHESVVDFIDSIMTTSTDEHSVAEYVKYQYHKCTKTCRKFTNQRKCRFNAPFPPMDRTRILTPFPEDFVIDAETQKKLIDLNTRLDFILSKDPSSIGSFDDLLANLKCNMDEYIMGIRSKLTRPKVFLKRLPKDCRINQYSVKILNLMKSNMDIQFVIDPYACVSYIVDYINKASRGLSTLLRNCVIDFKNGNYSLREKLKKVVNTFYNGAEISAQEAAWCRLRLPMSFCSVAVEFINTNHSKNRHRMLKSNAELLLLDPDSEDIVKCGWIERYSDRPDELESL